jgi:steroid delta-isomerase
MRDRVEALVRSFETLTPQSIPELGRLYATDCRFKDPFNDIRGRDELQAVFMHMFEQVDAPRFVVHERVVDAPRALLTWDFEFRFRRWRHGDTQTIHGASLLVFDTAGLVASHRDYWDAAEELYEKLPALGVLLRWLKRQGRPPAPLKK